MHRLVFNSCSTMFSGANSSREWSGLLRQKLLNLLTQELQACECGCDLSLQHLHIRGVPDRRCVINCNAEARRDARRWGSRL